MASLYTENSEKWKTLASIDYFTHFVKAWIPFNAWYKNYYPQLRTDREAINEIKSHPNKFRNKFISLLDGSSNESIFFKNRISELHLELERKHVYNKSSRINFESIVIEKNPQKQYLLLKRNLTYKVEREISGRANKEIDIFVIQQNGNYKFSYTQINGFNIQELTSHRDYLRLSNTQQENLCICYEEINPSKPCNLITHDYSSSLKMGNIHFINDKEILCKGIIEILYKLRNILFHGEIIPDRDTNKVYEPAYHILYTLIQVL